MKTIIKTSLSYFLSFLLFIGPNFSFATDLPDLGPINALSIDKEKKVGDIYMRILRASPSTIYDPVLDEYLNDLGYRLISHANDVKTPFNFFLVQNNELNAFAFFGGYVGVHTGLFLVADDESEFASVLAHEISHVTQRHLARQMAQSEQSTTPTILGVLGGILLSLAAPQAGLALIASTQALSMQYQINYSRQFEEDADRIGMQTLAASGFDPDGFTRFFTKLQAQYRFVSTPPQMLLTHPLTPARITAARNAAIHYPQRNYKDNLDFQLAKARITVRLSRNTPQEAKELYTNLIKTRGYAIKDAADYGLALALQELKDYQGANAIIDKLLAKNKNNLFYIDAKTDILLGLHKNSEAITMLNKHLNIKPTSLTINLNLANAYIESGAPQKAIPILKKITSQKTEYILGYQLLAEAYKRTNDRYQQLLTEATIYSLMANYEVSIKKLNSAENETSDRLEKSKINSKIKEYKVAITNLEEFK